MLHTKFGRDRPTGSGEKDFRCFTIYGHGGHLGHVTQMPRANLRPSIYGGSTQNVALIGKVVSKKVLKLWTTEHGYTIRSPIDEPLAQVS